MTISTRKSPSRIEESERLLRRAAPTAARGPDDIAAKSIAQSSAEAAHGPAPTASIRP